jgi:hypothetical protein
MNTIPNIKFIDGRFEGIISLPTWKNFQSRQGPYCSRDKMENSNGEFKVAIGGDSLDEHPTIKAEQINAYEFLVANAEAIKEAMLAKLLAEYKNLQSQYGYSEEEAKELMPNIDSVQQFENLIGLGNVHILEVSKDNVAYVGYEFGCNWDDEHGIGFMTHKNKIVNFGDTDMSFMTWVAQQDIDAAE